MMVKYRRISLKKEIIDFIEVFVSLYPEMGYRSIAQFVEDAIRRRCEHLKLYQIAIKKGK